MCSGGANHAGIQVKTCSECEGTPTCTKECIHDENAQAAHQQAIQEHQEETEPYRAKCHWIIRSQRGILCESGVLKIDADNP